MSTCNRGSALYAVTVTSAKDRLLQAAAEELFASGYRGATTKAIADRAGVNEVTLFRHFGSKLELMRAAMSNLVAPFAGAIPQPTASVRDDLVAIAERYVEFVDANPKIISRVLPEMVDEPELMELVIPIQAPVVGALAAIISHHQASGQLAAEPVDDALRAFIGPLAARAVMSHILDPGPFDADTHVGRYLHGRATKKG